MSTTYDPAANDVAGVAVDLDARRAARLERSGPKTVKHGNQLWKFKPELPMQSVEAFESKNLAAVFAAVLLDPADVDAFLAAGDLSQQDFLVLMAAVYGLNLGES